MRLELGKPVRCGEEPFGELADIVVDPTTKSVTHLVVRPTRADVLADRLVPMEITEPPDESGTIRLRCTIAEADELDTVEELAYLRLDEFPAEDAKWDVGVHSVLASPFYEGTGFGDPMGGYGANEAMIYDRVPKGEIEIRRSCPVYSSDEHHLGHVDGFVVGDDAHITHLVLERGHLWGRREVTIPIGAVEKTATDLVTLSLTKDEVGDLPTAHVHRFGAHLPGGGG